MSDYFKRNNFARFPYSRLLYNPSVCPISCIDYIWGYSTGDGMKRPEVIKI